jgi:hypothetical protein
MFGDGREFRLIQYEPDSKVGPFRILEVRFAHRPTSESPGDPAHYTGARIVIGPTGETLAHECDEAKVGDFGTRCGRWSRISMVCLAARPRRGSETSTRLWRLPARLGRRCESSFKPRTASQRIVCGRRLAAKGDESGRGVGLS